MMKEANELSISGQLRMLLIELSIEEKQIASGDARREVARRMGKDDIHRGSWSHARGVLKERFPYHYYERYLGSMGNIPTLGWHRSVDIQPIDQVELEKYATDIAKVCCNAIRSMTTAKPYIYDLESVRHTLINSVVEIIDSRLGLTGR